MGVSPWQLYQQYHDCVVTGRVMEYINSIGSYVPGLPDLPDLPEWPDFQCLLQVKQVDTFVLAVSGCLLLLSLVTIFAIRKWRSRPTKESHAENKSYLSKTEPRSPGNPNIKPKEAQKSKTTKWKKPDVEDKPKSTWLGGLTEKINQGSKEKKIDQNKSESKQEGWFSFSKNDIQEKKDDSSSNLKGSFMKPVHLNIDPNARPREVSKKKTDEEIQRVRKMCGEFREVVKIANKEDREEKQKDMEKVRSARSYFKAADRYRSESMNATPRIRFRTEEEVNDSYSRGNQNRLSQFVPGKINSRFTEVFHKECEDETLRPQKAPKKKIITLDQIMKQHSPQADENRMLKEMELEDLKQTRKKWKPPQIEKSEHVSGVKDEIINLQFESVPLKLRWKPQENNAVELKTLELPNKLDVDRVYPQVQESEEDENIKNIVGKELEELRTSRPKRFIKGLKERSASEHTPIRMNLPDDAWVVEKSELRVTEEKKKTQEELETMKQARLETLEVLENLEMERPSSRLEDQARYEAMKELEEVRKQRSVTMQDEATKNEVSQIVASKLDGEGESSNHESVALKSSQDTDADENSIRNLSNQRINSTINDNSIFGHEKRDEAKEEKEKQLTCKENQNDELTETMKEITDSAEIKPVDIAMAIAAEEMMDEYAAADVQTGLCYEDVDEEFEKKKKMIEEELREIEEQYKATQERSNGSQSIQTEVSPAESYEELTERLLKVAESIQDSARQLGKDDIDLSPRIERVQTLKDECKLSTLVQDTNSSGVQQTEQSFPDQRDTSVSEKANKKPKEHQRNGQDLANQEERFSSINAVPKIKFRDQFESNCKRKALESSQFQPDKINSKFRNIFEQQGQDQEITVRAQPKKRLITL